MLFLLQVWFVLSGGSIVAETGIQFPSSSIPFIESTSSPKSLSLSSLHASASHKPVGNDCICNQTDPYGFLWIVPANETLTINCKEGAIGDMTWTCYSSNDQCVFNTDQPDYSQCQSLEILALSNAVTDSETDVMDIWINISKFTSDLDAYYGHEISEILDLVTNLLDRQESEILNNTILHIRNEEKIYLSFQINTTVLGTKIMDNLISNNVQWDQLINAKLGADESFLKLLKVSDDIALRLSNVAQLEGQSLSCEISFPNVTISSSYWDGTQNPIFDFNLDNIAGSYLNDSKVFLHFPKKNCQSYIVLPNSVLVPLHSYKATGILLSPANFIQKILPGSNNTRSEVIKKVNSPLITLNLYNGSGDGNVIRQLPENSYIQTIYDHDTIAKYPSVQTIRRWLDEGEVPSAVIGSSLCSYLLLNGTNTSGGNVSLWSWDAKDCTVISTNRTHTICQCDHLYSFSDLMDFHEYIGPSVELFVINMTCSTISLTCLAMTTFLHTILWALKTSRTPITVNMCFSFFVFHLLLLLTLEKRFLHLNDIKCAVMGSLLHFFLLVCFMWFFVEVLQLYRLATNVFNVLTTSQWTTYYYFALAYSVPFLVVITTELLANIYSVDGIIGIYSGDEKCWLVGDIWIWSFIGPFIAILTGATIFMCIALLHSRNLQKSFLRDKIVGLANRILLLCLTLTWTTGFLLYGDIIVLDYIFAVVNCFPGVLMFIGRCVMNVRIRTAVVESFRLFKSYIL